MIAENTGRVEIMDVEPKILFSFSFQIMNHQTTKVINDLMGE